MDLEELPIRIDTDQALAVDSEGKNRDEAANLELERQERLKLVDANAADSDIQQMLAQLGQPVTVVGEDEESRRYRLAQLIYANKRVLYELKQFNPVGKTGEVEGNAPAEEEEEEEEEFLTPATEDLIAARRFLVQYSAERARKRLKKQRELATETSISMSHEINRRRTLNRNIQHIEISASQVVSTRPVSVVCISPVEQEVFASGSWAGDIKLLSRNTMNSICELPNAHTGKIGGIGWSSAGELLVSGSEDTTVKLLRYNRESRSIQEISTIKAHEKRVVNTKFHPSDKYFASASFDTTWKLWDTETSKELLLQEGHAKEVYSLAFQRDGALVCTGSLDNTGMIWDIRSGKSIMTLMGHAKPVYSVDWSPNGYQIATGGGDGIINIWDLRKNNIASKILGHNSIVSSLKFERNRGNCLVSSGYDKQVNIYSSDNWNKICSLEGHTNKILDVDVGQDAEFIISCGWDRSVKLWNMEDI